MNGYLKQIRQLKIAISFLLVVVFVVVFSFSWIVRGMTAQSYQKDMALNSLIDELGTIKQQQEELNAEIRSLERQQDFLQSATVHSAAEEVDMARALSEKEQTINELALKNQQLNEALQVPKDVSHLQTFLILGKNSGLTDTIMLAIANTSRKEIAFVSIPRDLFYKGRKINELYHFYGVEKLKEAVAAITNLPVQKYVVFDFENFKTLIDGLGGVDMMVEKKIVDTSYPTANLGYTTVIFQPGEQVMSGDKALQFARSRKSTSDFDRSKRQQQLVKAVVEKAKKTNISGDIPKALQLYSDVIAGTSTDINFFEALAYFTNFKDFSLKTDAVLSTSNFLYSTTSTGGQYILLPKGKNFGAIQKYVAEVGGL